MSLKHFNEKNQIQFGGYRNIIPLNVLKRGKITNYSINFNQHKNFYDFYSTNSVSNFLNVVYQNFKPDQGVKKYKFQGYFELVNQQHTVDNQGFLTENRNWLKRVFNTGYFNEFARAELFNEITKKVIVNGLTGSSWHFKRYECLNITVVPNNIKFVSG